VTGAPSGRFPGFSAAAQARHWDPVTAGVVLSRLGRTPAQAPRRGPPGATCPLRLSMAMCKTCYMGRTQPLSLRGGNPMASCTVAGMKVGDAEKVPRLPGSILATAVTRTERPVATTASTS
jgi:hypothetical protein